MKILILSDLHLTHSPFNPVVDGVRVDEHADVVVLAGDIHEGTKAFPWARETFDKPIVYVAGNHEFYGGHFDRTLDEMRAAARVHDIAFLEAEGKDIGGIRFLGCTLWTNFCLFGEDRKEGAAKRAKAAMNDFCVIKVTRTPEIHWLKGTYLTPELAERRHVASVDWLSKKLKNGDPAKTVVVTHHAPHPNSIPAHYRDNLLSAAYASDLTALMGRAGTWIHGHLHYSQDYRVNGTRIVANPKGYRYKNGGMENDLFSPSFLVEV